MLAIEAVSVTTSSKLGGRSTTMKEKQRESRSTIVVRRGGVRERERERARKEMFLNSTMYGMPNALNLISGAICVLRGSTNTRLAKKLWGKRLPECLCSMG